VDPDDNDTDKGVSAGLCYLTLLMLPVLPIVTVKKANVLRLQKCYDLVSNVVGLQKCYNLLSNVVGLQTTTKMPSRASADFEFRVRKSSATHSVSIC